MPLFFVHGVNVRKSDPTYKKDAARRTRLFRDVALRGLSVNDYNLASMSIRDIYWGDFGVSFAWGLASLPKVKTLDAFGPGDEVSLSDVTTAESLELIAGGEFVAPRVAHGTVVVTDSAIKRAAQEDPVRFAETLLMPLLLSEFELTDESTVEEGELQAVLAQATTESASDPDVQAAIAAAASDEALIKVLTSAIDSRFRELAQAGDDRETVESYGSDVIKDARLRIGELFSRALHLPGRLASAPTLQVLRPGFHRRFSRFLGDVFVYLQHRGDPAHPGPIVKTVIDEMRATPKQHPDEPVIVVTHSMGGNILYDIVTTFWTDICVDVWISVGGQVAQFEEMKLFLSSDINVKTPAKVKGIKDRVGYWLNVYDPTDSFGFMASPVFEDVDADVSFSTGASLLKSHGEYFGIASFHRLMREHVKKGLKLS